MFLINNYLSVSFEIPSVEFLSVGFSTLQVYKATHCFSLGNLHIKVKHGKPAVGELLLNSPAGKTRKSAAHASASPAPPLPA
jgi:hypothetical protein